MDTFCGRLRDAMLVMGLEPTPEVLSRVAGIPLSDATLLLDMQAVPSIVRSMTKCARSLKTRLIWLTSGATVPQVQGSLSPLDLEVLAVIADMDEREAKRWLKIGRQLAKL